MRLKYEIMFLRNSDSSFEITRLVPVKKVWKFNVPCEFADYTEEFLDNLIIGKKYIDSKLPIWIRESLISFFIKENMIALQELPDGNNPFRRQLEYFESWSETQSGAELQSKLKQSTILVIGAGGVGSVLANTLISSGINKVVVADYDFISTSNLARQTFYKKSDVGQIKVHALSDFINSRGLGICCGLNMRVDLNTIDSILDKFPELLDGIFHHLNMNNIEEI